jgi:hypothetical protein
MSIYLYSLRAKTVPVQTQSGMIRAHTLEMLHTNWRGMHDEDDCPTNHKMGQRAAIRYWEKGLPEFVALKADQGVFHLYRWTGAGPFWIDTDLVPGELMGDVKDGVLSPHVCTDRELYVNKIVCGDGFCRKTLEARPGEIDAFRAADAEEARRSLERHNREQAACAPYNEAKRKLDDLGHSWHRAGDDVTTAENDVKRLSEEVKRAQDRVARLQTERDAVASSWHAWKPEVERLEAQMKKTLENIKADYEAPALPSIGC